ncbi:MAG: primosomal protein N', partial [Bacteroidales bacterium]|nr:primosomal protein N' [Bacteroidales bacterium]
KYSDAERAEVWQKVSDGTYKLILGVRSAVFLPFQNLGLIVVDEEHETTYKQQDPAPRYHARDVANVLTKLHNAKLILGTATPSLETYYNCINNKYARVILNSRYGNVEMPNIVVADTLDAYKRKVMQLHFHPILIDEIRTAFSKNEQVILFRNRRGYTPYTECGDCGYVVKCEFCNVSLTYHKNRKSLLCHYCGNAIKPLIQCPDCGSNKLHSKGYGTEQIEEEVAHFFPDAIISRLDLDTTSSRKNYEKIISDFENHRSDILIGTQMISKGLDFDNVSIVGILNADSMLNFPDFRAFERSFQMMVQVSGRAGRRDKRGKVIIQTTMPEHDIIRDIINTNYEAMAERELEERTYFRYPPIFRFIQIKLSHTSSETLWASANYMAEKLIEILPGRIMGPEEPLVNKIQNRYILNITLRFETSISSVKVKESIMQIANETENYSEFKGIRIILDVDPI